jgi:tRNA threonylcarbamoyl adenosine modification protein (Sua5/YciO/YrdC/YwlC family)
VPRRLQNPKRQTIGIRVPDHPVPAALLAELGEPLMSSTLLMPGDDVPLSDPDEIMQVLKGRIDLLIDSGHGGVEPSTVVDLTGDLPVVVRRGKGPTTPFE